MTNLEQMQRDLWPSQRPPVPVSGLAIASLILGLLTVIPALLATLMNGVGALAVLAYLVIGVTPGIVAVVLGHVGLSSTRRGERRGRGMALWGLALGYYAIFGWLVVSMALALLGLR